MEQRLIALPSIALSISVLALGVTIGSGGCRSAPTPAALSVHFGFGLNLSTLAPLLTLSWHAFSLISSYLAPTAAAAAASHDYYRPLSESPSAAVAGESHHPAIATRTRVRVWAPRALASLWVLNTLLVLFVPRWSPAIAFSYAGLAVLSALEAGVLALGGMLAQCQIQRELAGETDDDYRWENDQGDDGDDMKLGEVSPA